MGIVGTVERRERVVAGLQRHLEGDRPDRPCVCIASARRFFNIMICVITRIYLV